MRNWKYIPSALWAPENDSGAVEAGEETVSDQLGGQVEAAVAGSDAPTEPETPAPESPNPTTKPWFYDRIDTLTRRLRETEKALAEAKAPVPEQQAQIPAGTYTQADLDRRAAELADMRDFNTRTNAVWNEGLRTFPDFQANVAQLQQVAGGELPVGFVMTLLDLDAPVKVLQALGKDPETAYQILSEPSVAKLATKLAKYEAKLTTAPKISSAPPPVAPKAAAGAARATANVYDEGLSIAEFMALRNAKR